MKIKDLNYYVKFIFSSEMDDFCFSTTDRETLNNVVFNATGISPMDYKINDMIRIVPNTQPYQIIDITIRQLIKDTSTSKYGFDIDSCANKQGIDKDYLFSILISMKPI